MDGWGERIGEEVGEADEADGSAVVSLEVQRRSMALRT